MCVFGVIFKQREDVMCVFDVIFKQREDVIHTVQKGNDTRGRRTKNRALLLNANVIDKSNGSSLFVCKGFIRSNFLRARRIKNKRKQKKPIHR